MKFWGGGGGGRDGTGGGAAVHVSIVMRVASSDHQLTAIGLLSIEYWTGRAGNGDSELVAPEISSLTLDYGISDKIR